MKPIDGMTTEPYGMPEMGGAWYGCLLWAADKPELVEAFEAETGMTFDAITSKGLARMIDDSTGRTRATVVAWCDWVTRNFWGEAETRQPAVESPGH